MEYKRNDFRGTNTLEEKAWDILYERYASQFDHSDIEVYRLPTASDAQQLADLIVKKDANIAGILSSAGICPQSVLIGETYQVYLWYESEVSKIGLKEPNV